MLNGSVFKKRAMAVDNSHKNPLIHFPSDSLYTSFVGKEENNSIIINNLNFTKKIQIISRFKSIGEIFSVKFMDSRVFNLYFREHLNL